MLLLIVTMRKKISHYTLFIILAFIIPIFAFAQVGSWPGLIPSLFGDATQTGRRAAQDFYNQFPKKPIPLSLCENITELNENLYKSVDILKDFEQNKQPNQVGVIVLVKTEACCKNKDRPCATTTAAFEKESTPLLDRFKIYGIQVAPGDVGTKDDQEKTPWKQEVKKSYQFNQGPGAKIVAILPDGKRFFTDAAGLGLLSGNVNPPKLESFLNNVIAQVPRQDQSQQQKPVLYTDPPNCGPCRTLEAQLDREIPDWRKYITISKNFRANNVNSIPYLVDPSGKAVAGAGQIAIYKSYIQKYVNENKNTNTNTPSKPVVVFFGPKEGYYEDFQEIKNKIHFFHIDIEKCRNGKMTLNFLDGQKMTIKCPPSNAPKDRIFVMINGKYSDKQTLDDFLAKHKPADVPNTDTSNNDKPTIPGNFDMLSDDGAILFIHRHFSKELQDKLSFGSLEFYDDGSGVIYVKGQVCTVNIVPKFCITTDGLMKLSDFKKKVNDAFRDIKSPSTPIDPKKPLSQLISDQEKELEEANKAKKEKLEGLLKEIERLRNAK